MNGLTREYELDVSGGPRRITASLSTTNILDGILARGGQDP
jgi:hypothetical protein